MNNKKIIPILLVILGALVFLAVLKNINKKPAESGVVEKQEYQIVKKEEVVSKKEDKKPQEFAQSEGGDIILYTPLAESQISSPLHISGKARGNWFFEATFPVILTNWDGLIIAEGVAQAKSDWMTEEFVDFEAEFVFDKPDVTVSNRAALILKKDNPSGLPENDDALEITVFFK